ncbi:MAG: MXAN_6640 family putative metalloprotease [Candidatus Neomarinimicrobiota bacterium]|nr:MXAN_6640 family putative metalloprotease [Candidatus Neomarinimicrobiota bacterium]
MRKTTFLFIILLEVSFAKLPGNIDQSVEIVIQSFSGNNQERCISPHLRNVALYGNQLNTEQQLRLSQVGFQFGGPIASRSSEDRAESEGLDQTLDNGYFRFHYTTTGTHAVANTDTNSNNIPDFVDNIVNVFAYVASTQLDSFSYTEPPSDSWYPANADNGGSSHYDIYIRNLESNVYGYVAPENFAQAGNFGDNENSSTTELNALTSYMALRNNYSGFPGTEEESIKVTAAHEFHHAIQSGYDGFEAQWLMEATAVVMEEQIYDEINDCYQYLPSWFNEPHKALDDQSDHWYGSFIYFQYIYEHLGGYLQLRSIWNKSILNDSYYGDYSHRAISLALSSEGSSFSDALNKMVVANRVMSSNTNAGVFAYEEAEAYPVNGPTTFTDITYTAGTPQTITSTNLNRFASQYTHLISSDPFIASLTNTTGPDTDLNMHAIISYENNSWTVYSGNQINIDPTSAVSVYLAVVSQDTSGNNWDYQIEITDGELLLENEYIPTSISVSQNYPNPFNPSTSFNVEIPHQQHLSINIISIDGKHIKQITNKTHDQGIVTFHWDGRTKAGEYASTGQYFIVVKGDNFQRWINATLLK